MELDELRTVLIERYVASGYDRARAEGVIDAAISVHRAGVAFRTERTRAVLNTLPAGLERTHYLGTLMSLEMQHTHMLLAALQEAVPETVQ